MLSLSNDFMVEPYANYKMEKNEEILLGKMTTHEDLTYKKLNFDDDTVEPVHCCVQYISGKEWWFTPSRSNFGSYARILGAEQRIINIGDTLAVGNHKLILDSYNKIYSIWAASFNGATDELAFYHDNSIVGREKLLTPNGCEDDKVSRCHFEILYDEKKNKIYVRDGAFIEDDNGEDKWKQSTNGTWIQIPIKTVVFQAPKMIKIGEYSYVLLRSPQ